MKYLLLQFGNGTQMAKVLETNGNNMIILRMDASHLYWKHRTSKMKVTDSRILKEFSLEEALAYVYERESRLYKSSSPKTRRRRCRTIGYAHWKAIENAYWTPEKINEANKVQSERFAAVVAGIKADFASVPDDLKNS